MAEVREPFLLPNNFQSITFCYITLFYYLIAYITFGNYLRVYVILFFFVLGVPFLVWKLSENKDFVSFTTGPSEPRVVPGIYISTLKARIIP